MAPSSRASITVLVLYLVYRIYCVVVSPLTTPEVRDHAPAFIAKADSPLPSDSIVVAREHLPPSEAWAADAKIQLHLEREGFVYFNDYLPINDDRRNRLRITPFALVWFDPRRSDGVPYTVTCQTAIIEFEKKVEFGLGGSQDNRIVGGEFNGEVTITGPDGLKILGRNVRLLEGSNERGSLYSDFKVSFAYGPAAGRRQQVRGEAFGFEITLTSGDESILGQDMPRISGMEKIVLRRDVSLDILMEERERLLPVSVQCTDEFTYDIEELLATFNINVHVSRPTHEPGQPEQYDRLACDRLSLQFEPKHPDTPLADEIRDDEPLIQPVAGTSASPRRRRAGIDLDLELRSALAIGNEVFLTSEENELQCRMSDLFYDVPSRKAHMRHDEQVEVRFGSSFVACPDIQLIHDERSHIRSARCEGAGWARYTNRDTGDPEVESTWSERLTLAEDAARNCDCLELFGDARVVHHQQQMGIVGDVLHVWFDGQLMRSSGDRLRQSLSGDGHGGVRSLRRIVAEQTGEAPVTLVSPRLQLETGRVEANFTEAAAALPLGPNENGGLSLDGLDGESSAQELIRVTAGDVRVAVTVDPATSKADVSELTASTDVRVVRNGHDGPIDKSEHALDGPFSVECENLVVRNNTAGQVLQLHGAPAVIRLADAQTEIEGNEILFDRAQNEGRVTGPGTIARDVDQDLEGHALETPERLRVKWREAMQFDGQLASFLGATETTLADSVMKCHKMDVTLNRHVSFTEDPPQTDALEIEKIDCRGGVTVEYHGWEGHSTIKEFRYLAVAEFSFDHTTGIFTALGPGHVKDWQRDDGRRRVPISPPNDSRASQAGAIGEQEWNYTWLWFAGELRGNQHDRYVVLKDSVKAIHGPVAHPLQTIERGELDADTETARNSVWLRSDQMNLQLRSAGTPDAKDWLEVVAFGNAELEGKVFRARADEISYHEAKGQFSLKGKGSDAGIWVQRAPGQPAYQIQGKTAHAIPSENRYWGDRLTGIRFSP